MELSANRRDKYGNTNVRRKDKKVRKREKHVIKKTREYYVLKTQLSYIENSKTSPSFR